MARSQFTDPLLNNKFMVLDISIQFPLVLLPVFSFKSVTMPTLSLDIMDIKSGNFEFPAKVVRGATVSSVTLEQGVSLINSDFYDWIIKAVTGSVTPRTLLIVQFHRAAFDSISNNAARNVASALSVPISLTNKIGSSLSPGFNFEFVDRIPGRAWILHRCKPLTYRPGSDLNAESPEVSLASLEIAVEEFDEISLAPL